MASTPKPVRRNSGYCICADRQGVQGFCRYGCCVEYRCPRCHGKLAGWGPVACKCDGAPRWMRHPGMKQPGRWVSKNDNEGEFVLVHAAVKPKRGRTRKEAE